MSALNQIMQKSVDNMTALEYAVWRLALIVEADERRSWKPKNSAENAAAELAAKDAEIANLRRMLEEYEIGR